MPVTAMFRGLLDDAWTNVRRIEWINGLVLAAVWTAKKDGRCRVLLSTTNWQHACDFADPVRQQRSDGAFRQLILTCFIAIDNYDCKPHFGVIYPYRRVGKRILRQFVRSIRIFAFALLMSASVLAMELSAFQTTAPPPQTIITTPGLPTTGAPAFTPPPTALSPQSGFGTPAVGTPPPFGTPPMGTTQFGTPAVGTPPPFGAPPTTGPVLTNPTVAPTTNQPFPVFPQAAPNTVPPGSPYTPVAPNQYQGTGSNWLPNTNWEQSWNSFQNDFLPRLVERPRARYTFIGGSGEKDELGINDFELATTFTIGDFLGTSQPLRISPGFIFHWWEGPNTDLNPGFDLPARAYSTYLQFDHLTNPANQSGLESNFTIGYYSDFKNNSSYAIRFTGRVLGWVRVNPYTIGKFGIEYLDRVDKKLLPAFGVYMAPNSDIKWDLFFPRTKLAHRTYNLFNGEAWVYIGAEYGGGSWAVQRIGGVNDQADINDVRAFIGVDWLGPRLVSGFFEFGYVFNRQIVYRSNALDKLDLKDAFMIRTGLAF